MHIVPIFFVGVVQTSKRGIHETKNASEIYSTTSIKNVLIVTEDTPGVLNSTYVLHGLGIAISLFLLLIVIQLCKKSKSTKRNRVTREAREETDSHNESQFQQQEENRRSYMSIPESVKTIQVYRSLEAEYDEINEQIPIHYPSSSNSSFNNENTNISFKQMPLKLHDSMKDDMKLEHKSYPVIVCEDNSDSIASEGNASRNIEEVDTYIDPF